MTVTDDDIYDYLEHFGVVGMRWGVRRSAKERNKALNKASRQKDKEEHAAKVERAREKIESGKTQSEYKKAKAQHKTNKEELGTREARKILNKAKNKRMETVNTANQYKNGKEFATAALVGLGTVALISLATAKR